MGLESGVTGGMWINRKTRACVLALVGAVVASVGCTTTSFQTARTLDTGKSKFYVAPSAMRVSVGGQATTLPFIEVGTRYGLTDELEVGGHIGAGLGVDVKWSVVRAPDPSTGWDISFAPGMGYIGGFSGVPTGGDALHFFGVTAPLLITKNLGERFSVTVGPRAMYLLQAVAADGAQTTQMISVGTSVAAEIRLSDSIKLVPGFGVGAVVFRNMTNFGSDAGFDGQRIFQAGVGVAFGG